VARHLPECYNFSLGKFASNPTIPASGSLAWTSAPNVVPPVDYTITATNTNTAPAAIAPSVNIFEPSGNPTAGTLMPPVNSTVAIGLGQSQTLSTALTGPIPLTQSTITNCAGLQAVGPLSGPDWYAAWAPFAQPPAPQLKSCVTIPVLKTTTLNVMKNFVDATGVSTLIGPLTFNVTVTCSPYGVPATLLSLTTPATATTSGSPAVQGHVTNVPVASGETCKVNEPSLPTIPAIAQQICGNTAYWDSSPAYTPSQTIPISANVPNVVTVTNTLRCQTPPQINLKVIKDVVDMTPGGANHPLSPYLVTLGCNPASNPATISLTAGVPTNVAAPLGANCTTPHELLPPVPPPAIQACSVLGAAGTAHWETPAFVPPSFTVTSAGPQIVHVIDVLRCGIQDSPGTLTVLKQISGPAGIVPPPTAFSLSVKCGTQPATPMTLSASAMQTVVASPPNCTVSETPPSPLTFSAPSCGTGVATWVTPPTYAPSSSMTVNYGTAAAVVVTNSYACVPGINVH
jgi:hypothetical protein